MLSICILPFPALPSTCSCGPFRLGWRWGHDKNRGWRGRWWWSRHLRHRARQYMFQPIVSVVLPEIILLAMCNFLSYIQNFNIRAFHVVLNKAFVYYFILDVQDSRIKFTRKGAKKTQQESSNMFRKTSL